MSWYVPVASSGIALFIVGVVIRLLALRSRTVERILALDLVGQVIWFAGILVALGSTVIASINGII